MMVAAQSLPFGFLEEDGALIDACPAVVPVQLLWSLSVVVQITAEDSYWDTYGIYLATARPPDHRMTGLSRGGYIAQELAIEHPERVGRICAPTPVLAGRQDPGVPLELAEKLFRAISGARLTVVRCAHAPWRPRRYDAR